MDLITFKVGSLDICNVCRCGHVLNDTVKELLNALVTICGSAEYRNDRTGNGCLSECCLESGHIRLCSLKILLKEIIVCLAD